MIKIKIKPLRIKYEEPILKLDERFKSSWSKRLYINRIHAFPKLSRGAYKDDRLVGFILGKRKPASTYVSRIVVEKDLEGKGIGTKLLKDLEKHSDKRQMESLIRASNLRSIHLHKKCKYERDKKYNYTYRNGELGLRFYKLLK
jgi:ribosomal protein S18 acetylase RimI-like enzyme